MTRLFALATSTVLTGGLVSLPLTPLEARQRAPLVAKARRAPPRAKTPASKPAPSYDAGAVNDPQTIDTVGPGVVGSAVLRAQILLDRWHFSPGEIDGQYGDNLRVSIAGFQATHNLPANGVIDAATWQLLNADPGPVLVPYTIAPADVAGPFEQIPHDPMDQAKLQSLGYESPEEQLGERFHINPKLLAKLNPDKNLAQAGEQILVPNVARQYTLQAARIEVSKSKRTVTAFGPDGAPLAQYPATMGSVHDPLPIGAWKITVVQHNPVFYYNPDLFWDAKPQDAKAKIAPGPNNPVGTVWMSLSKEHYGIHGTPDPGRIGHTESHGCIRLTNWDAEELSRMVKVGTPAILEE